MDPLLVTPRVDPGDAVVPIPDIRTSQYSVDVVIPVLNEAHVLAKSVSTVRAFLREHLPYESRVLIVDNGSTDGTDRVGQDLERRYQDVEYLQLAQRGRGRALRHAWSHSRADVVCYTDVDLSTELAALPILVDAILNQGYDLGTGSRLMKASRTTRSFKREVISRAYNVLIKAVLWTSFSDAQCGFKVVSRQVVDDIVPQIKDESWFFDTELLVLAEKRGYRIKDLPVQWIEDDDSRVKIVSTAWEDIKGVMRLRWRLLLEAVGYRDRSELAEPKRILP
jgi:glycosyltransferase involved in cell wall biosynthesis